MTTAVLTDFRQRHRGPVIDAADAGYDPARLTFNGMIDRRPELIARPLEALEADFNLVSTGSRRIAHQLEKLVQIR